MRLRGLTYCFLQSSNAYVRCDGDLSQRIACLEHQLYHIDNITTYSESSR